MPGHTIASAGLADTIPVLDVGAGEDPHPEATHTLDIRTDIAVDYPGVDIARDRWPLDSDSVERVVCRHVLEDIPRPQLTHVFDELHRVLVAGGTAQIRVPHLGGYLDARNPRHERGFSVRLGDHLDRGSVMYWPDYEWAARSWAVVMFPTCVRRRWRAHRRVERALHAFEVLKVPYVDAEVVVELEMPG